MIFYFAGGFMFHDILNEFDYNNLLVLKDITVSISNLYDRLCNLEINGKHNSEEYKKLYEYLLIALDVEKNHYKSMNLNYLKIVAFLEYINLDIKNNIWEGIINQNYNDKIKYRVLKQFLNFLQINQSYYNQYIMDAINSGFEIENYEAQTIKDEIELDLALQSDIDSLFVRYLQDLIDNNLYETYKKQLIMTKYLCSFIENDLIIINKNLLLNISTFNAVSELQQLPNDEKQEFIKDTQSESLKENIAKIMLPNKKCRKKNTLTKLLLRDCYIRAQLEVFELPYLVYIDNEIQNLINKYNLYETHSIGSTLVVNSIKEAISDKILKYIKK